MGGEPFGVTATTIADVTSGDGGTRRWMVLAVRLPVEPSRHRVAVWRELRRAGAISLGHGLWALPETPAFREGVDRAIELIQRGEGELVQLDATGHAASDSAQLEEMFTAAREAEWQEFLADCDKYEAELERETAQGKFTLAELDEEEQSLERLRRWHRELKFRDFFGAPSASVAEKSLRHVGGLLEAYAERVYDAVHQT